MERVTEAGLWAEVGEALRRGALVVTANERAARTLRRRYDEGIRAAGGERWEPARVMSWAAWTSSLWRRMLLEGRAKALLLNGFQEHAVWRGVVAADRDGSGGGWGQRGVDGLAQMAAESWARMCAYGEPAPARRGSRTLDFAAMLPGGVGGAGAGSGLSGSLFSGGLFSGGLFSDAAAEEGGNRDTAAFGRWARAFEERCGAEQFLTVAELEAALWRALGSGLVALETKELLLVGFDRMTPAAERLLGRLRGTGVLVSRAGVGRIAERRVLTSAADVGEELRACARWAAGWMRREPGARLAVIVPDVGGERAGLERVFREVLAPELELIGSNAGAPYEFSLGRALAEVPMVAVAMELLRWAEVRLPLGRVSGLLVSDYFAASARGEREARAEFDALELRRAGMLRPEMGLVETVRRVAGSRRSTRLPGLLRALRGMERVAAGFDGVSQSYGQWAAGMREVLAAAEWGAGGAERSEEFQVRERWEGALDAMSTLDFENQAVDYAEALRAMERIAGKTIFAPESRLAAVQVMGPLEAAGSEFEAVWFLRTGELSWPPVVGALPLLPWGLQRDLGMPGTDAESDLAMARVVTERIGRSGREVVMSYARNGGEAGRQRASGVVRAMGLEEVGIGEVAGEEEPRAVVAMEWAEDGGRVRALPDAAVHGGVRVLELQAACGFRAFAEQRLWSSELEDRGLGLNAKESGTAVHAALECFWREVGSQAALLAMRGEERDGAVLRAVDEGLRRARVGAAGAWDEAYLATQRERLRRLLGGWLEMEMGRPAFTVQQSEERLQDVRVGPLRFQLRVDRVDVVDEMQVLIDYKTGAAGTKDWLGERPDAPQVPLYAIVAARGGRAVEPGGSEGEGGGEPKADGGRGELGAVAFGRVKVGKELGLRGFAAREGLLPAKPARMEASTFEGQVERWEGVLTELAEEFAAGEARVRPKNYPSTCERCGQRILCRLDASLLEEMDEDEVGEDSDG